MNVSAISTKNLIGGKPAEEASSGTVTGNATTPALFMLMLLQQCTTTPQAKTVAVNSKAETLEPAMSFFGEIATAQSETSNPAIGSTITKGSAGQKNLNTVIGNVEGKSSTVPLTFAATTSEGMASLLRTIQNTNTTMDAGNSKQSASPSTTPISLKSPATDVAESTEAGKIISPVLSNVAQAIPTGSEFVNTASLSQKLKSTTESAVQKNETLIAEIPNGKSEGIPATPVDTVVAVNSASINMLKPVKEQISSANQKSTEKDSDEKIVKVENVAAVSQEAQANVTDVQAVSQSALNTQGKSTSQKSNDQSDNRDTTVTATESSSTSSNWSETLKTQTEAPRSATPVLHNSVSSTGISTTHADQTIGSVHGTDIGKESAPGLTKMPEVLLDQVVNSIVVQVHDKSSQMKILLQPESLGEMFVKVKVEDGKVNTQIEVSNPATKVMLESNLGQLRETLSARGVDMQHIEILASNQTGLGTSDGRSETQGQKSKRSFYNDTEDISEESLHDLGYNTMEFVI